MTTKVLIVNHGPRPILVKVHNNPTKLYPSDNVNVYVYSGGPDVTVEEVKNEEANNP